MRVSSWLAKFIMGAQATAPRGSGGYSTEAFAARGTICPFPQAETEVVNVDGLFQKFPLGVDPRLLFHDATILDFGSGYGGRTVEYCLTYGAKFAWGVEPFEHVVQLSNEYAAADRCRFIQCSDTKIPLPDESVDLVVSYDVLEHVVDPVISVHEIRRVLRPQGKVVIAFPVYDGAMSHHLDYIVRLPGIHWIFSATTLIEAVNSILTGDEGRKRFGTSPQPFPKHSHDGSRLVLPSKWYDR